MTVYKARQGPSVNNEVELKELKALLKKYSCHHFAGKTKLSAPKNRPLILSKIDITMTTINKKL